MNALAVSIFVFASILRIAGNMYYAGMEDRMWVYWYSRNIFEVLAVLAVLVFAKGIPRAIVAFFLGTTIYSATKELTCPTCLNWSEYVGFAIGGLLFIFYLIRHARIKRKEFNNRVYK